MRVEFRSGAALLGLEPRHPVWKTDHLHSMKIWNVLCATRCPAPCTAGVSSSALLVWQLDPSRQLQERFGDQIEGLPLNLAMDVAAAVQAEFLRDRHHRFALARQVQVGRDLLQRWDYQRR